MNFEGNKKFCENCNEELAENALFCGNCGLEIKEENKIKFCYQCGETLKEDAVFCTKCGQKAFKEENTVILEEISFVDTFRKITSSRLMLIIAVLSVILSVVKIVALDVINSPMYILLAVGSFVLWGKAKKGSDLSKTTKLFKATSVLWIISEILLLVFIVVFVGVLLYALQTLTKGEDELIHILSIILVIGAFIGIAISIVFVIILAKAMFKTLKNTKKSLETNTDLVSNKIMFLAIFLIVIGGSSASSVVNTFITIESDYDTIYEILPENVIEILEYMIENIYMNQIGIILLAIITILFGVLLINLRSSLKK